jgi:hypothetical protein
LFHAADDEWQRGRQDHEASPIRAFEHDEF